MEWCAEPPCALRLAREPVARQTAHHSAGFHKTEKALRAFRILRRCGVSASFPFQRVCSRPKVQYPSFPGNCPLWPVVCTHRTDGLPSGNGGPSTLQALRSVGFPVLSPSGGNRCLGRVPTCSDMAGWHRCQPCRLCRCASVKKYCVRLGVVLRCFHMVWPGTARRGKAGQGMARQGKGEKATRAIWWPFPFKAPSRPVERFSGQRIPAYRQALKTRCTALLCARIKPCWPSSCSGSRTPLGD